MTDNTTVENRIILGDPVPWFSAPLVTGGSFDLHVSAGRWVVLSFLGSPTDPRAIAETHRTGARQRERSTKTTSWSAACSPGRPDDVAKFAAHQQQQAVLPRRL